MNRLILTSFFIIFCFTFLLSAQENSSSDSSNDPKTMAEALKTKKITIGGYGALSMKFSSLDNNESWFTNDSNFAYIIGAKGGMTFNNKWTLGAGFYVAANKVPYRCRENDSTAFCKNQNKHIMILGYGGGYFSYLFEIRKYIGIETGFLIGGGSLKGKIDKRDYWDDDYYSSDEFSFFVFEPEIQTVFKITNFFGMGIGAGYRLIAINKNENAYTLQDLSGPSISIDARLGVF